MSNPDEIEAFIIHLARAKARRPQVERILAACPVPAHVIDAVDGRALSTDEVQAAYSRKSRHAPRYPFALSVGEIGCFLSHRKAWQAILDAGLDAGLVIEDDAEIDAEALKPALRLAGQHIARHGIIQFQVRAIAKPGPVIASQADVRLTRPVQIPLRASCTLYSRRAAQRLLDQTVRFDRPVDTYMQMHWLTGLRPCLAIPSGVSDKAGDVGGTTIQARNVRLLKRLRRELLRPIYRYRVARLSRVNDRPENWA